jgi:hypothetical protein
MNPSLKRYIIKLCHQKQKHKENQNHKEISNADSQEVLKILGEIEIYKMQQDKEHLSNLKLVK